MASGGPHSANAGARDNLLEDYGAVTGYEASSSCDAWAGRSPLELVRGGACGVRAADAAEAAFSSSIEAAARGALALKQVISRVLGAASRVDGVLMVRDGE